MWGSRLGGCRAEKSSKRSGSPVTEAMELSAHMRDSTGRYHGHIDSHEQSKLLREVLFGTGRYILEQYIFAAHVCGAELEEDTRRGDRKAEPRVFRHALRFTGDVKKNGYASIAMSARAAGEKGIFTSKVLRGLLILAGFLSGDSPGVMNDGATRSCALHRSRAGDFFYVIWHSRLFCASALRRRKGSLRRADGCECCKIRRPCGSVKACRSFWTTRG